MSLFYGAKKSWTVLYELFDIMCLFLSPSCSLSFCLSGVYAKMEEIFTKNYFLCHIIYHSSLYVTFGVFLLSILDIRHASSLVTEKSTLRDNKKKFLLYNLYSLWFFFFCFFFLLLLLFRTRRRYIFFGSYKFLYGCVCTRDIEWIRELIFFF